jgi:hypothetical protein
MDTISILLAYVNNMNNNRNIISYIEDDGGMKFQREESSLQGNKNVRKDGQESESV